MVCKACGLPELRYAICDRWDCPNLLLRATIEGDGKLYISEVGQWRRAACSQCGKYPCECDDC